MTKYFFIGDSRTVGDAAAHGIKLRKGQAFVSAAGNDGNYYYAYGGKGYSWFEGAIKNNNLIQTIKNSNSDVIVIRLGVNDVAGYGSDQYDDATRHALSRKTAQKYIAKAKELEQKTGKKVVFVTADPLDAARYYYPNKWLPSGRIPHADKAIITFNNELLQSGIPCVNTYDFMKPKVTDKKQCPDSVHFSPATTLEHHNYMIKNLDNRNYSTTRLSNNNNTSHTTRSQTTTQRSTRTTTTTQRSTRTTTTSQTSRQSKPTNKQTPTTNQQTVKQQMKADAAQIQWTINAIPYYLQEKLKELNLLDKTAALMSSKKLKDYMDSDEFQNLLRKNKQSAEKLDAYINDKKARKQDFIYACGRSR